MTKEEEQEVLELIKKKPQIEEYARLYDNYIQYFQHNWVITCNEEEFNKVKEYLKDDKKGLCTL